MLEKERLMRIGISLERIAEALERKNELKEKELEFIKYQSEIMLKEYELNFQRNMAIKEQEDEEILGKF